MVKPPRHLRKSKIRTEPSARPVSVSDQVATPRFLRWWLICFLSILFVVTAGWYFSTGRSSADRIQPRASAKATIVQRRTAEELEAFLQLPQVEKNKLPALDTQYWTERTDEAIGKLRQELPDDVLASHLCGLINLRLKRTELAESSFRHCVKLDPNNLNVKLDYANLLVQHGRDHEALQQLQTDPNSVKPTFAYLVQTGILQDRLGLLDEAEATFLQASNLVTEDADLWVRLGKVQLQLRKFAQSESAARRALVINHQDREALNLLHRALLMQKKKSEAAEVLVQLKQPPSVAQHAQHGQHAQHAPHARVSYAEQHSTEMRAVFGGVFRSLGTLYQAKQRTSEALQFFETAAELDPNNVMTLGSWAALLNKQQNHSKNAEISRLLIRLEPNNFAHYQSLSVSAMHLQQTEQAQAALELACLRFQDNGQAHLALAKLLLFLNKPVAAVEPSKRAAQLLATPEALTMLQQAMQKSGQSL
jgi:cytochrome c-type biogenesis protein CcmH/NrfG